MLSPKRTNGTLQEDGTWVYSNPAASGRGPHSKEWLQCKWPRLFLRNVTAVGYEITPTLYSFRDSIPTEYVTLSLSSDIIATE